MPWEFEEYCSDETEIIYEVEESESSEDPPIHEWSSLIIGIPDDDEKKKTHGQSLYDPVSGEIWDKYIGISDSGVLRHLYFDYPAVTDPGIHEALFRPEKPITYPDDGQELYVATCNDTGQVPIKTFFRGLLREEINLAYYCVSSKGVRAMALALYDNTIVKKINLTENFLTDDACYHLGEMLMINSTLQELNLSGCKIRSSGAQRLLKGLARNRSLKTLKLDKNELGDEGAEYVGKAIVQGLNIHELYLSYNNINARGTTALAGAFESRSTFVKLDFSWNNFVAPRPTYCLLARLGESETIQEIDLSWNALAGPRIGTAIKLLMNASNLRYLNLSNNRLSNEAIVNLIGNIGKAHNLVTLDLSFNPLTPKDALSVLLKMKSASVHVQNLLLENVFVTAEFLEVLQEIKEMKKIFVTYGGLVSSFKGVGPDLREVVLKRAEFLSKRSKKHPVDIALIVMKLMKDNVHEMVAKDFTALIRASGAPLDINLIDTIVEAFATSNGPKNKNINVIMLADYVQRLWPDKRLPPTPPPELECEPKLKLKSKRNQKSKRKKR